MQPTLRKEQAMSDAERVEVLVVGGGKSGKLLAWDMAKAGHRTVSIERRWIGGSCPNINCLPSKNEVKSAEVADVVRHAGAFGTAAADVRTDMSQVLARKRKMVDAEVAFHLGAYRASGAELLLGEAHFVAPKAVEVTLNDGGTRRLHGDRVFLNLGTRPYVPAIPGLAESAMTNIELLELDRLPSQLVVLGGGYVGLEFAQAYRRFGSRVTVIEQGKQVLSREDPDVAEAVQRLFADDEIEVLLGTSVTRVEGKRGALRVLVRTGDRERAIQATDILVATGRTPNTDGIGLDVAGISLDRRGYIAVNDRLEASAPDVWAMGECAGSPQFTHIAGDDFRIVRDNLRGGKRSTCGRQVPSCVFIDPPLARLGLNEVEARSSGVPVRVAKLPVAAILRTETTGETRGFLKAVVHAQRDDILGFTMFGADAGEVMAVVQIAMLAGLPFTRLRDAVLAHPTMAEGLGTLFEGVPSPRA
jgi:pyruvate/2-oxoglutarate dehydrogenase complex dihydrolipoamide dehydrogenase (E3) component